ncbi:MAG: DUF4242 domain-containing protein [Gemmatimonadetes bacterium]|nr:DUF4242 domain-containing protein [Gemmatimonadota bacterium]
MAQIVVEQSFDPPLTPESFGRLAERVEPCLEAYGVLWVRSYLAMDRRRMVCHFEAPDTEVVRAALRSADASFDRAWSAEVRLPDPSPAG